MIRLVIATLGRNRYPRVRPSRIPASATRRVFSMAYCTQLADWITSSQ